MSKYELDDNLVRAISGTVWSSNVQLDELAAQLREQLPLPVPSKIGAVVRATHNSGGVFTRWGTDEQVDRPWVDSTDGEHVQTERLGRITEVLSEGVDL